MSLFYRNHCFKMLRKCINLGICTKSRYEERRRNRLHEFRRYNTRNSNTARVIASIFIIFIAYDRFLTYAAVARVPDFVDLAHAFEGSRCEVRGELIDVRQEHKSLPSEAIYSPSCVKVNRCSGCCQSDSVQCVPTSVYTTRVQISQRIMIPTFSYVIRTFEFTHHESCACKSRDETRPVCVQEACQAKTTWDPGQCRCVANTTNTCIQTSCDHGQRWNQDTCLCESTCVPQIRRCPLGQRWDMRSCNCIQKCPAQDCPHGKQWNPITCQCRCRPCHERKLFHFRFKQDKHTCHCSCKSEENVRRSCKRRQWDFDEKRCTCKGSSSHRGR